MMRDIGDNYCLMRSYQKVQITSANQFIFDLVHENDILHGVNRILMLFNDANGDHTYAFTDPNITIRECIRIINITLNYDMNINDIRVAMSDTEDINNIQSVMDKKVRDISILQFDIGNN